MEGALASPCNAASASRRDQPLLHPAAAVTVVPKSRYDARGDGVPPRKKISPQAAGGRHRFGKPGVASHDRDVGCTATSSTASR